MWQDTITSIRNCDAVSNEDEKDLIDFVQTKSDTRTYRFLDESGIIGRLNNL